MNGVLKNINDLKNDLESGSTSIAIKGIEILFDALKKTSSLEELNRVKDEIINSKPAMTAVKNLINAAFFQIKNSNGVISQLCKQDFINRINTASSQTIENALNYFMKTQPSTIFYLLLQFNSKKTI